MTLNFYALQFPKEYVEFLRLFNDGRYWHSHEALEALWLRGRSTFYKGLIIYASVFVHAERGNPRGVKKQLVKVRRHLPPYAPYYLGINVRRLLAHADVCDAFVAGTHPPEGERLAKKFPYDVLEVSADRVRGDEPELHEQ